MSLATLFEDIANAIREKDGTTEAIEANTFPARIQEIETGYKIDLSVDPPGSGTVSGGGRASAGMKVTVSATDDLENGYEFTGWKENNRIVGTAKEYSFSVAKNRSLMAKMRAYDFWFRSATLPSSECWSSVTYGNGKFVAVAGNNSNKAAYSTERGQTA